MLHKTIPLIRKATLTTYIHEESETRKGQIPVRPAVIVLPGGAYGYIEHREGEPAALTFMKEGFNTFVLNYSIKEESVFPNPLEEISLAVWTVRKNCEAWNIDPNKITVLGFSAGACICSMLSTQWDNDEMIKRLNIPKEGNRPNAVVMGYGAASNKGVMEEAKYIPDFLGKISRDMTPELELIDYINKDTAPTFIWHTRNDRNVPCKQPLQYAQKLFEFDIPFEIHVFDGARHGLSVCNYLSAYKDPDLLDAPNLKEWVPLCVNWLFRIFKI